MLTILQLDQKSQIGYNTCILNNKEKLMLERGKIRVIEELLAQWQSGELSSYDFAEAVKKVLSV
jgi:CRISPR/Cas system CMR subunit Cmr4 (Cas7 group RAMP superfamily)